MFKNRIVNAGHSVLMADGGMTDRFHHYLVERAKGGAAAIILGSSPVHPSSRMFERELHLWREEIIPGFQRLSRAVHQYGAYVLIQLWHSGRYAVTQRSGLPQLAPSPIPGLNRAEVPKEIEPEEIDEIVASYGLAAQRAQAGGLDGVEVQLASDYFLGSFLSPALNHRTDEYGGSRENRLRIVQRVIEEIRRAVGIDCIVGLRLSGDYMIPGGQLGISEVKEIVRLLAATSRLDYFNVMAGSYYREETMLPSFYQPRLSTIPYAVAVKEVTELPVLGIGRIPDVEMCEQLLVTKKIDLVGLVRPLIADPELPNKAAASRTEDIRPCVFCNHCRGLVWLGVAAACTHNAAVGREHEWGIDTLEPAKRAKSVMIIGGGPAGMEAARVAALRGHRVTLYEKEQELGGQLRFYKQVQRSKEYYGVVSYLERQIQKLGCELHLGIDVTPDVIRQTAPDAVVVATGSMPLKTGFRAARPDHPVLPGIEHAQVLSSWDVFHPSQDLGRSVIVIAEAGQPETQPTVEYLVQMGKHVIVITPELAYGFLTLGQMGELPTVNQWLAEQGVEVLCQHAPVEILPTGGVRIRHIFTQAEKVIEADRIVLVMMRAANATLYRALKGQMTELHRIGDCVAPRYVQSAIAEGHHIGRVL